MVAEKYRSFAFTQDDTDGLFFTLTIRVTLSPVEGPKPLPTVFPLILHRKWKKAG